ncbi:hypothetical protein [Streptomonospora wellingtoniae]|uniref:Uncharacterized protein n=1 Tax=Streptomonospora wellingtoniae TaxID=3075544 RepID=A0ABU2KY44_9ACTN|nr:hypothetical protein [Streptomonospora sp. DSM 45055]MDT0304235.1 hypothetical protein [Streptomonospora sp. DSM 45055]
MAIIAIIVEYRVLIFHEKPFNREYIGTPDSISLVERKRAAIALLLERTRPRMLSTHSKRKLNKQLRVQLRSLDRELERLRCAEDREMEEVRSQARYDSLMIVIFYLIFMILIVLELIVLGVHGSLIKLPIQANFAIPGMFCAALSMAILMPLGRHFTLDFHPEWVVRRLNLRWRSRVFMALMVSAMLAIFIVSFIIALP